MFSMTTYKAIISEKIETVKTNIPKVLPYIGGENMQFSQHLYWQDNIAHCLMTQADRQCLRTSSFLSC